MSQGGSASLPAASEVGAVARTLITGLTEPKTRRCLKLTPRYIAEMFAEIAYAMTALLHLEVLHAKDLKQRISDDRAVRGCIESMALKEMLNE